MRSWNAAATAAAAALILSACAVDSGGAAFAPVRPAKRGAVAAASVSKAYRFLDAMMDRVRSPEIDAAARAEGFDGGPAEKFQGCRDL